MFIEFGNNLVDLNCIESAGIVKEYPVTFINMVGKSGAVYKESFHTENFPEEKKIFDDRWLGIKMALRGLNLSFNNPDDMMEEIPF
jgi:hypothetical protein